MTEVEAFHNITYVSSYFGEVMGQDAAAADVVTALHPHNLVLFCDNAVTERYFYEQRRARNLEDQTVIVRLPPQPLPLTVSHIAHVEENRMIWVPCAETLTPRDCVLGFSRYELMLRVLDENPFESEYFAWVEGDAVAAKNATAPQLPNKISCECRGYIPPAITSRWHRFFALETKSDEVLSLDLFVGDATTIRRFCRAVLKKFRNCLSAGFGNFRDSQIAYLVYRDHPEWFDLRFLENSTPDNLVATAQQAQDWDFLRATFRSKMKLPKSDPRSAILHPTINPEIFERFVRTEIMKAAVGGFPQPGNDGLEKNLYGRPGYMPYHLLGYISGLFREKKLLVVGENTYDAALALCTNPANTVLMVVVAADPPLHRPRNLDLAPADLLLQPEKFWESHIHAAAVIFLEGSPRTQLFFDFLRARKFEGLVILNGAYITAAEVLLAMKELEFADWSEYGSYTGTIAIRAKP